MVAENNKTELKYSIKDFIGTFDGYISTELCNNLIDLFEKERSLQKVWNRQNSEGASKVHKNDEAMTMSRDSEGEKSELFRNLLQEFRPVMDLYLQETDYLHYSGIQELHVTTNKIQKTVPTGGYHVWHVEKDYNRICSRALVYTIYLNDIISGGETEFLFQKTRVSAKQGRVCIFPAQFPYVHRGNPPLDGAKYIVTSWLHAGNIPLS